MDLRILKEETQLCLERELTRRDRAEARTRFLLAVIAGIIGLGIFNADLLKFVIEQWNVSFLAKALVICLVLIAACAFIAFIMAIFVLHFYNLRTVPDAQEFARVREGYPNLDDTGLYQSLIEMYAKLTYENSNRNAKTEWYVLTMSVLTTVISILFVVFAALSIALKVKFS